MRFYALFFLFVFPSTGFSAFEIEQYLGLYETEYYNISAKKLNSLHKNKKLGYGRISSAEVNRDGKDYRRYQLILGDRNSVCFDYGVRIDLYQEKGKPDDWRPLIHDPIYNRKWLKLVAPEGPSLQYEGVGEPGYPPEMGLFLLPDQKLFYRKRKWEMYASLSGPEPDPQWVTEVYLLKKAKKDFCKNP